mmetsp:Transcript_994/g.1930  ORF Transcript_994/g.1930 Transcript_994/m.1930 type:complete len:231 (+) Transcript_994:53-745(+)
MSKQRISTGSKQASPVEEKENTSRRRRREDKKDKTQETKQVRFHGRVMRRTVQRIPEEDHENVWYTSTYYEDARKREDSLQRYVSSNKQIYKSIRENLYAEGVMTEEQESRLTDIINAASKAVLKEQEKQEFAFYGKREDFSLDHKKIAKAYRSHSEKSLKEAQRRAARHEKHLEALGINFAGYSSPHSPSAYAKKGILRRKSTKSRTSLATSSKREIPRPPVHSHAISV